MPSYEIVIGSPQLRPRVERRVAADTAEAALDAFLASKDPHGVKRTGETTAVFLDEVTVAARAEDVEQERQRGFAANISSWDKRRGASRSAA